jgi:hypothetical protein
MGPAILAQTYSAIGAIEATFMASSVPGDEVLGGHGVVTYFTVILDHGRRLFVEP